MKQDAIKKRLPLGIALKLRTKKVEQDKKKEQSKTACRKPYEKE